MNPKSNEVKKMYSISGLLWVVDRRIERVFRKSGWMIDSRVGGRLGLVPHCRICFTINFSRDFVSRDGGVVKRGRRVCGSFEGGVIRQGRGVCGSVDGGVIWQGRGVCGSVGSDIK